MGEVLEALGLGVAVFQTGQSLLTSGDFSSEATTVSYIHERTPPSQVFRQCTTEFSLKAHHPRYGFGTQTFWFRLAFEYNGNDLRNIAIVALVHRSSSLYSSTFTVRFVGQAHSVPSAPVAEVMFLINGRWNPVGRGDVSFWGNLWVRADGATSLSISSEQNWVWAGSPPGICVRVTPRADGGGVQGFGSYLTSPAVPSDTAGGPGNVRFGGLGWFVKSSVVPEGHELLTRNAAAGLPLSAHEMDLLREGVRRPDTASLTAHVMPGEQRRHFLRQTILHSTATAHRDATNHLRSLHGSILAPGTSPDEKFRLIGEALHLIQDSFAPAHVDRHPSSGQIRYIRNFGPANMAVPPIASPFLPGEHGFPADLRDRIHSGLPYSGTLKPEARQAIDASRQYLVMTLRQIRSAVPTITAMGELEDFIRSRFPL